MIRIVTRMTRKILSDKAKKQCRNSKGQFVKTKQCELGTCGKTCINSKCDVEIEKISLYSVIIPIIVFMAVILFFIAKGNLNG